jgi:NADH-quinone oxidoreductase subunit C
LQAPDLTALIAQLFSAGIQDAETADEGPGVVVRLPSERVVDALCALRDADDEYAMLVDLFGNDTGEGIEVTYHLRSFARDQEFYLRVSIPYGGEIPSAWRAYPAALYPEREAAEHFGIRFPGHPNPKRLITTDEIPAPLLLKSTEIRSVEETRDGRAGCVPWEEPGECRG